MWRTERGRSRCWAGNTAHGHWETLSRGMYSNYNKDYGPRHNPNAAEVDISTCESGTVISAREAPPPAAPRASLRSSTHFQPHAVCPHNCVIQTHLLRGPSPRNSSPWVPWLQITHFSPLYSRTPRSPPTGCRPRYSSGTGAPCRTRWPESGASSSRSRWEWRRSPHFRVRTDQPHTTPCQVNVSKSQLTFH